MMHTLENIDVLGVEEAQVQACKEWFPGTTVKIAVFEKDLCKVSYKVLASRSGVWYDAVE